MERIIKNEAVTYDLMNEYIDSLCARYSSLRLTSLGQSVMGKELFCIRIGEGKRKVMYVGATHGLEWLTTLVLLRFCEELLLAERENTCIHGYRARDLLKGVSLAVVPMLNPDGADLAQKGISACGKYKEQIYDICKFDFSNWSANANGVDLNHNFNADWYSLRDYEAEQGITKPSPRRFGGFYPESEPEVKALTSILRKVHFHRLYSFHSQGEEIFFEYGKNTPQGSLLIAKALAGVTDYALVANAGHYSSGGLKDWFIEEFREPGFTIEIGKGKNPLPIENFEEIYQRIEPLAVLGLVL